MIPSDSIKRLTESLHSLGVEFAVVRGIAVSLIARPRFTADIDAVMLDADIRLEEILLGLEKLGYVPRTSDPILTTRRTRVLTLWDKDGIGIDLMLGVLPFDVSLVRNSVTVTIREEFHVPVASA